MSRRQNQDQYLAASRDVGFAALLGGVLDIFRATNSKRKYFALLEQLELMGLLRLPPEMKEIMAGQDLRGVSEASVAVEVTATVTDCIIVYVQPHGSGDDIINFEEFRTTVLRHDDPVSRRFAQSLEEWARMTPHTTLGLR